MKQGFRKQGGTMIHTIKRWASMDLQRDSDIHGRWIKVAINENNNQRLTVISAYRVCSNSLDTAGENTIWLQEYTSLLEQGNSNPNPRQQILDDLKEEIFQLQNDPNHNVILFIDANKSLYTSKKNKLNQFIQSSKLVNIHQSLHPQLKETPTNVVGSRQIDYCFISTELIPNIERAGILPINYTMISDH